MASSDEIKQKLMNSLNTIKDEDKMNYLINKLIQFEIDSSKIQAEANNFQAQTKRASLVSVFALFFI